MSIVIRGVALPTEREWIDVRVYQNGTAIVTGERAQRSTHTVIDVPDSVVEKYPPKTCLSCSASFSDDNNELHCMNQNERVVSEYDVCWEWNR